MGVNASHDVWQGNPFTILTTQGGLLGRHQHAGRGQRGRLREVQQGEGHGGPLHPPPAPYRRRHHHLASRSLLCPLRLLPGPVLHAYPGVDRLVPPQVVVVLELLVADGTDVGDTARPGHRLDWGGRREGMDDREQEVLKKIYTNLT